jgi:bifunctional DNA-binding transcriptional regulator/antitoxin component of YhaV-PrlF toxin-antitoxin module
MKTTLNGEGQIGIPEEVRVADHLAAGDSFELERLRPGRYLLSRQEASFSSYEVVTAEDGLPLIRAPGATLTAEAVKELESRTP